MHRAAGRKSPSSRFRTGNGRSCSTASPPDFPHADLRLRLALGAEIPPSVELNEFAPLLLDQVPKLRGFRFVLTGDELVIVAPQDRGIALVLER
jgi:hypothetical protein